MKNREDACWWLGGLTFSGGLQFGGLLFILVSAKYLRQVPLTFSLTESLFIDHLSWEANI